MVEHDFRDLPSIIEQDEVNRLGWTAGRSFIAYGLRFGLRMNDPATLSQACAAVPLGWHAAPAGEVDVLYSLRVAPPSAQAGMRNDHLLYCGSALIARAPDLAPLLTMFNKHAELLTAFRARELLFVHAGVVGWRGSSILIPGRSMTGKTTLIRALVEAGATYYSDEFALLDQQGLVHPYPLPLSIRGEHGQPPCPTPVEALGGQAGAEPLPVGLVVATSYQPGARWRPRVLSPGQALLALMDNTVAAQREPDYTMPILRAVVLAATIVRSTRGEAGPTARALLRRLEMIHDRRGGS
ncbi:MAG: hypothetical protein ACJ8CR_25225 [Roseiflexaceae bacterium]